MLNLIRMTIKWVDSEITESVIAAIGTYQPDQEVDDDEIFYYFSGEDDLKTYMTESDEDFVVLDWKYI